MNNLNWFSELVYYGIFCFTIITSLIFIAITIIYCIKGIKLKKPIITFVSCIIISSIVGGCVAYSDYTKDKWFYTMKKDIMQDYKIVNKMEFILGRVNLSLFIYCNIDIQKENIEPVFTYIKNYLFNNSSGFNVSQQSYLSRKSGSYKQIDICFYSPNIKISYYADYYKDGSRKELDNFMTWHIEETPLAENAEGSP